MAQISIEGEPTQVTPSKRLSRRDFLGLITFGSLAAAGVYLGLDKWSSISASAKEKLAQAALTNKVSSGALGPDLFRGIATLDDFKANVESETRKLTGVSASGLYIARNGVSTGAGTGRFSDDFVPGSLIKLPLMHRIWQKGVESGVDYLPQEVANAVLEKSESARDFISRLPFAKGKDTDTIILELLSETGLKPSVNQNGNIELPMLDYFRYTRTADFPPVILNGLRQTPEDYDTNYGVSEVMLRNFRGSESIYFKLGLAEDGSELVNSYFIRIGDNTYVTGYARGENYEQVHTQMLIVGGSVATLANN
jgi:hypothetical protein